MPIINPSNDPLAFMSFLSNSDWTKVVIEFPSKDNWASIRRIVEDLLDFVLKGEFYVMLGDESKLTDTSAEYIIRTATTEDLCRVGVAYQHIQDLINLRKIL